MAYLQDFRHMPQKPEEIFRRGQWDCAPGVLLDMADDTLNSWREAHDLFDLLQGDSKEVTVEAFTAMRRLVHRVIRQEILNLETSYTNEAITYALLLRWIDQRQQGLALGEKFE